MDDHSESESACKRYKGVDVVKDDENVICMDADHEVCAPERGAHSTPNENNSNNDSGLSKVENKIFQKSNIITTIKDNCTFEDLPEIPTVDLYADSHNEFNVDNGTDNAASTSLPLTGADNTAFTSEVDSGFEVACNVSVEESAADTSADTPPTAANVVVNVSQNAKTEAATGDATPKRLFSNIVRNYRVTACMSSTSSSSPSSSPILASSSNFIASNKIEHVEVTSNSSISSLIDSISSPFQVESPPIEDLPAVSAADSNADAEFNVNNGTDNAASSSSFTVANNAAFSTDADISLEVACNVTVDDSAAAATLDTLADTPPTAENAESTAATNSGTASTPMRSFGNRRRIYRASAYVSSPSSSSPSNSPVRENESSNILNTPNNIENSIPSPDLPGIDSDNDSHDDFDHNNDDDNNDDDDDSDDDREYMNEANSADGVDELNEVLSKPKPSYTWNSTYELMRREHGLSSNGRASVRNGFTCDFNSRYYSSRHVIERMKLSHCLRKHSGCVNCLNFNRNGDLLVSGSDDLRIIIWDWAQNKSKHVFRSGHSQNIFQTKFINSGGCLDIVSASRDGQVRRAFVPSSGKVHTSCLYKHRGAVHKLVVCPESPFEIISVGEDGYIRHKDMRTSENKTEMLKVVGSKDSKKKVRLFSISHHPFAPEICVCGCDNFVRVYDKRNMGKTVHEMCPEHLLETSIPQVTCSVYNSTGSEILSSYSDDHIYLFDSKNYKPGEYLHRYRGRYNHRTIKGVNFFGPNSEYIISGSDCGNIFFWEKNTEAIVNFMPGDTAGVVNCLEPHPSIPVLATSGLDHNIKIWTPHSEKYPPDLSMLELCVKRNLRRAVIDEANAFDDRQFHAFLRQFLRNPPGGNRATNDSNDDDDDDATVSNAVHPDPDWWISSSSSSSSSSNNSQDEYPHLQGIHCSTQ